MELRQLRYFVRIVELGSMGRAAIDLDVVQSALSQQISRLESELSTRLLQRTGRGTTPTEAGLAFFAEAQLTLRHADQAVLVAKHARLMGAVSVGMAPTTASVLGMPFMQAMRERYPDVRLHLVEGMSGHLATMLNARKIDLALAFNAQEVPRWSVTPLLEEQLLFIRARRGGEAASQATGIIEMAELAREPLILPTAPHGLRRTIDAACQRARVVPNLIAEIDSLSILMASVEAGLGGTVQPGAALGRYADAVQRFHIAPLADKAARRQNAVASLPEGELAPAALAVRVVLIDTARTLVKAGRWPGATLVD
jgi:LysR family tcuABC transcriptional regulator